jgi:hypothetical protein
MECVSKNSKLVTQSRSCIRTVDKPILGKLRLGGNDRFTLPLFHARSLDIFEVFDYDCMGSSWDVTVACQLDGFKTGIVLPVEEQELVSMIRI